VDCKFGETVAAGFFLSINLFPYFDGVHLLSLFDVKVNIITVLIFKSVLVLDNLHSFLPFQSSLPEPWLLVKIQEEIKNRLKL
jgi:hypothetical protein